MGRKINTADSTTSEGRDWSVLWVGLLILAIVGGVLFFMATSGHAPAVAGIMLLPLQVLGLAAVLLGAAMLAYGIAKRRPLIIVISVCAILVSVFVWRAFLAEVLADDPNDDLPLVAMAVLFF